MNLAPKAKTTDWTLKNEFVDERSHCSLWEAIRMAIDVLVIELSTTGSRNPASITIESNERKYEIVVHRKK